MSSHLLPEISAHLLAASPTCHYLEYVDWADGILEEPLQIQDGLARVPDRPGIGLTWRSEVVKAPVAGPLINLFARGMRQLANRRRTQQKKDGDPCFIPEIIQQLCRNHNFLVARLSAHRGEAPGWGSRYLAPKEGAQ